MQPIKHILFILTAAFFASCEKPEPLWDLPPAGDETLVSVNMGPEYEKAIFFSFQTGTCVTRDLNTWHLAFASGANEHHVMLNGGNEVQAFNAHDTSFSKNYAAGMNSPWQWDNPNGDKDSTAFACWYNYANRQSNNQVFIADLGKNAPQRYKKIKLLCTDSVSYTMLYANTNGTDAHLVTITKNRNSHFTYYNFNTHETVAFEPETPWDIVFTRYRHIYYDMNPVTPYYVAGALINSKRTAASVVEQTSFGKLDATAALQLPLSSKTDVIGFGWKRYDLNNSGKYIVYPEKSYVIKDFNGYLYKLKFLDFYDDKGTKGCPKFVYQRL